MKKFFFLMLAVLAFVACQNAPQRYFENSPEIETVKAGIKAYESQDWETWKANFSDTAKIFHNSTKGLSPDETMENFKSMLANIESYGFNDNINEIEMIIDPKGRTWVNYWNHWKGITKVTNKEINIPVHLTLQFIDGKIVQEYAYYDTAPIQNAFEEIEKVNYMPIEEKEANAKLDVFVNEFLNNKNSSVLADILAKDYVRYMNDVKDSASPEDLVSSMNVFFTGFPDFKISNPQRSSLAGNTIFVHWEMTGTNTGEFNGSPATGNKVKISGLSRLHFNGEGKIDEENVYFDQLNMMQQLGKTIN
ncbi:nuclear transport factor 2 family protein [Aestuariivivens sediminis]|uniref:nuclear transport factor 2 family protein n=1 Tax=Aestuariivivens sediminis TaxID=2913557 RepID=UPI001F5884F2|nr:nuclear transport factor 2 family protein [Aestuariivivens sediminis]